MQQFMQKNCIQSISLKLIQNSASACIIMEQTAPLCLGNISKHFSVDNMKKKNRIKLICLRS